MTPGAWRSLLLTGLAAAVLAAGCGPPPTRSEFTEVHMGVPVRLVLYAASDDAARDAARAGFARIRELDAILSDYRPDSELNALSATSHRWVPVSADLFAALARARDIAERTDGAFDPTLGPLVRLWRTARDGGQLPDPAVLAQARQRSGWPLLDLDAERQMARLGADGMQLDLGGIGKGFILDRALDAIAGAGVTRVLIEAGGDIRVGAAPPGEAGWRIQVPDDTGELGARAAALTRAAIATSGADIQFVDIDGVRYSHVIDPATGLGVTGARTVRVIAADGATADALATALGVAGPVRGLAILAAFPEAVVAMSSADPRPR